MDPWEAVKWIAIFRLVLPERAVPPLRRPRREPRASCSRSRSRAGVNGVMMGNFLTTLGNTPEQDRAMFESQGLNIARQPDNGANPRPDNRSGVLEGETPDVVEEFLDDWTPERRGGPDGPALGPVEQLRYRAEGQGGAAATRRRAERLARRRARLADGRVARRCPTSSSASTSSRTWGSTAACAWSAARRARASCSTASRSCCSARTTTSGSPTIRACARRPPTPRCAGASAPAPRAWCPAR